MGEGSVCPRCGGSGISDWARSGGRERPCPRCDGAKVILPPDAPPPPLGLRLRGLVQTCGACPSQWDAVTTRGDVLYIRYRWGLLTVREDRVDGRGATRWRRDYRDPYHGVMETEEMLRETGMTLAAE